MPRARRTDGRTCTIPGCDKDFYGRGMCNMHLKRQVRKGSTDKPDNTRPEAERFWEKVEKTDTCWNWTGALSSGSYGSFAVFHEGVRKNIIAHRWTYATFKGELVEGMHLDHLCRNTRCVNPDHLEQVTPLVNMQRGVIPNMQVKLTNICRRGHSMEDAFTFTGTSGRACRTCVLTGMKARRSGMTFAEVVASGWVPRPRTHPDREEAA